MRTHEAASALLESTPWDVVPFRRVTRLIRHANDDSTAAQLSLSSKGFLYERAVEGEGSQASSDETVRRNWQVEPEDLVVNPMWLVGGGIARSTLHGCVSPDYRVYRCDRRIDSRYLAYLMRTPPYIDQYRLYTRGDTTFDRRVSRHDFEDLPVAVPGRGTQEKIVDLLDLQTGQIEGMISLAEHQLRLAEERLSRVVSEVLSVEGGLPFTSLPGAVPSGYRPLWLAAATFSGKTLQPTQAFENEAPTPYLKASNIGYESVLWDELETMWASPQERQALQIRVGDVFVIEGGATAGKVAMLDVEPSELTILQNHVHCIRAGSEFEQRYLYWVLRAYYSSGWYPTITSAVTFGSFPASKLRALPVPNINMREQRRVVSELDEKLQSIMQLRKRTSSLTDLLNERKQALITAAVTGQIEI